MSGTVHMPAVISEVFGVARSEARRLIVQEAVTLNGEPVTVEHMDVAREQVEGAHLTLGRKREVWIGRIEDVVFPAAISMFGLRWINSTSLHWHLRPDCPILKANETRSGWQPFPITLGRGRWFYTACGRCAYG